MVSLIYLFIAFEVGSDAFLPAFEHLVAEEVEKDEQHTCPFCLQVSHKEQTVVYAMQQYRYPENTSGLAPTHIAKVQHGIEIAHGYGKHKMPRHGKHSARDSYLLP